MEYLENSSQKDRERENNFYSDDIIKRSSEEIDNYRYSQKPITVLLITAVAIAIALLAVLEYLW